MILEGIAIGLCIGIGGMFLSSKFYQDILILKAESKDKTPEKLGKKFYYIVPEEEYLDMEIAWLTKENEIIKI